MCLGEGLFWSSLFGVLCLSGFSFLLSSQCLGNSLLKFHWILPAILPLSTPLGIPIILILDFSVSFISLIDALALFRSSSMCLISSVLKWVIFQFWCCFFCSIHSVVEAFCCVLQLMCFSLDPFYRFDLCGEIFFEFLEFLPSFLTVSEEFYDDFSCISCLGDPQYLHPEALRLIWSFVYFWGKY